MFTTFLFYSKYQAISISASSMSAWSPSLIRDKIPIKELFHELKDLDRRLETSGTDEPALTGVAGNALEVASIVGSTGSLEGLKAEKKQVKRVIQTWLNDFEAREGRPAQSK